MTSLGITFRPATAVDSDVLADLVLGDAEQETTRVQMRLFGLSDLEDRRLVIRLVWRAGENWRQSTLAEVAGVPVGLVQVDHAGMKVTPQLVFALVGRLGPVAPFRIAWRLRLRPRVTVAIPPGAYEISELHVSPAFRGRGIGEALLRFAESDARERRFTTMALQTLTTNPAQKLYERNGFRTVAVRTDAQFERITGAAGNVLMVRDLC